MSTNKKHENFVNNSANPNTGGGQKKSDVMVAAVTARIASTPKTPTHTVRASIFAIIVVVTIIVIMIVIAIIMVIITIIVSIIMVIHRW